MLSFWARAAGAGQHGRWRGSAEGSTRVSGHGLPWDGAGLPVFEGKGQGQFRRTEADSAMKVCLSRALEQPGWEVLRP